MRKSLSAIEKIQIEIDFTQKCIDAAESETAPEMKDNLGIFKDKAFRNGLLRAKALLEGADVNV